MARRGLLAGAAGLTLGLVGACSGERTAPRTETRRAATDSAPRAGGVLRGLLDEEPATLDPLTPSGGVGNQLAAFVYSRLFRFRPGQGAPADGAVEGDLVAAWEQPDPETLVLRLRDGVRFDHRAPTDGRFLSADDVVASWDALVARGTYRTDLATAAHPDAPVRALRATDARTLALSLAAPDAQLLPTLASRFGLWVLPREGLSGGFDPRLEMRGSGPWLLERNQPSAGFTFRRNPAYTLAPAVPLLDAVELPVIAESAQAQAQFRAGNIHGGPALGGAAVDAVNILQTHRDLPGTRIDLLPPPLLGPTLAFGWREGSPFRDPRVRRAVSLLLDRDALIEAFSDLSGFQAAGLPLRATWTTPLSAAWGTAWLDPKGSAFGPSAAFLHYDPAESRRLLRAAGYPDGFETPFTFISGAHWGRDWASRAEMLMAMLGEGRIRCRPQAVRYNLDFIPRYLRSAGDFDGLAMQRTGSRGDPGQFWSIFFSSAGASTQVGRHFPALDALILRQRQELEPARRVAVQHEIQRYFAEQLPAVPMGGHTEQPVLAWSRLRGPDAHRMWGGADLGADAFPWYWLEK